MKIEIDFSRPDGLRKQKRELEMALATIDGALAAIYKNDRDKPNEPTFPQIPPVVESSSNGSVDAIIAALPKEFNMRQAKEAAETAEIPDSRLRREMNILVEGGSLILVEKGQGRRPATFRKV
jgi:hypothetical protein